MAIWYSNWLSFVYYVLSDLQYLECCYITFPEFFFIYFWYCIYRCRCRCSFQSLFWSCLSYTRFVDLCSKQNVFPAFVSFKCALHSLSLFLSYCLSLSILLFAFPSYCLSLSHILCLSFLLFVSLSFSHFKYTSLSLY